ncbi:MAG: hypothetical protein HYX90_07345 [Chloroflexi bacterium]|nr:hypothetical protein [Chloroflexota bacterium]
MVRLEKQGIPTVTVIADPFLGDAKVSARALGLKEFALTVTHTDAISNLSKEEVDKLIDDSIEQVISGLTKEQPPEKDSVVVSSESVKYEGKDFLQAYDALNEGFLEQGWGDGFPIVPPTEEAVQRMLQGTKRSPDDLVCILQPGMGRATVRKIAINAVMAGCKPGHMPILMAAADAITDPRFNIRSMIVSTSPHAPMLMVNGPIVKKLGINSGMCALGPGAPSAANTAIGRAFRLILINIAQARVGTLDMDTIGSPNKYSMCLAENEEKTPWEPYHVEKGFDRQTSTVTVFDVESQINIINLASTTPEGILTTMAGTAVVPGSGGILFWPLGRRHGYNLLLVCPEHAAIFSKYGWTKQEVKEYIYHHARMPISNWTPGVRPERVPVGYKWMLNAPENATMPITAGPEFFDVAVVGAVVGKSSYIVGASEPVTREIGA